MLLRSLELLMSVKPWTSSRSSSLTSSATSSSPLQGHLFGNISYMRQIVRSQCYQSNDLPCVCTSAVSTNDHFSSLSGGSASSNFVVEFSDPEGSTICRNYTTFSRLLLKSFNHLPFLSLPLIRTTAVLPVSLTFQHKHTDRSLFITLHS